MTDKRDNSGTLSCNKKREHDKQPEFDGVGYWISGWVREGDDGRLRGHQREGSPAGRDRCRQEAGKSDYESYPTPSRLN